MNNTYIFLRAFLLFEWQHFWKRRFSVFCFSFKLGHFIYAMFFHFVKWYSNRCLPVFQNKFKSNWIKIIFYTVFLIIATVYISVNFFTLQEFTSYKPMIFGSYFFRFLLQPILFFRGPSTPIILSCNISCPVRERLYVAPGLLKNTSIFSLLFLIHTYSYW